MRNSIKYGTLISLNGEQFEELTKRKSYYFNDIFRKKGFLTDWKYNKKHKEPQFTINS